jgi:hypothetical protein
MPSASASAASASSRDWAQDGYPAGVFAWCERATGGGLSSPYDAWEAQHARRAARLGAPGAGAVVATRGSSYTLPGYVDNYPLGYVNLARTARTHEGPGTA